jgi:hypothetical protein
MLGRSQNQFGIRVPRRLVYGFLLLVFAATAWFFWRVWDNVSTLSSRTLPGIAHATEMLDRAADMEISRRSGGDSRGLWQHFSESMDSYEKTIAVEQDRRNLSSVRDAFATYTLNANPETWQRLRAEIRALHQFRQQRAQLFVSDSKEQFASALVVNLGGLICFSLLLALAALYLALARPVDVRPDNF